MDGACFAARKAKALRLIRPAVSKPNFIVANGSSRKQDAYDVIRTEVSARHAEEFKQAGPWRRLTLWLRMEREIYEELKKRLPPEPLYAGRPADEEQT